VLACCLNSDNLSSEESAFIRFSYSWLISTFTLRICTTCNSLQLFCSSSSNQPAHLHNVPVKMTHKVSCQNTATAGILKLLFGTFITHVLLFSVLHSIQTYKLCQVLIVLTHNLWAVCKQDILCLYFFYFCLRICKKMQNTTRKETANSDAAWGVTAH